MALNNATVQDPFSKDDYIARFAYDAQNRVEYVGRARPGTADSDGRWQIMKYTYDVNGLVTATAFVNGDHEYKYVWNDGASLVYSNYTYS